MLKIQENCTNHFRNLFPFQIAQFSQYYATNQWAKEAHSGTDTGIRPALWLVESCSAGCHLLEKNEFLENKLAENISSQGTD